MKPSSLISPASVMVILAMVAHAVCFEEAPLPEVSQSRRPQRNMGRSWIEALLADGSDQRRQKARRFCDWRSGEGGSQKDAEESTGQASQVRLECTSFWNYELIAIQKSVY